MRIQPPRPVAELMEALAAAGFDAYAVGGCVRDSLLGRQPGDWDIATDALPQQVKGCFPGRRVLETGLGHGTVTILIDGTGYEVTTFRVDGAYTDNRRPDSVSFTRSLREDLARRDFTVNAMAWNPEQGIIDPFGGGADLARRRIVCVGEPEARFREDALRILRGVRFASALDFAVEAETASAMERCAHLLERIAAERIRAELDAALTGPGILRAFRDHAAVILRVIPELEPTVGFEQNNPHHHLDVWQHILSAVAGGRREPPVRLALLLHDVGKPRCYGEGEDGVGHFYGHARLGAEMAAEILSRLRYDNVTIRRVERLIRYHDSGVTPEPKSIRRWLNRLGEEDLRLLLAVKRGDILAHAPWCAVRGEKQIDEVERLLDTVVAEEQCFQLRDLAVNGRDLLALGVREGQAVGRWLDRLLERVIDGALPNDRRALLSWLEKELASDVDDVDDVADMGLRPKPRLGP